MSLINDALKEARKAPPPSTPSALPPLQPVAVEPSPAAPWVLPAVAMLLMVAAIFFIGWAVAHHTVRPPAAAPKTSGAVKAAAAMTPPGAPPPVAAVLPPVVTPRPEPLPPAGPPPASPPAAPKLQAIFYRPQAPSAIIDGQTVQPGDQFRQYRVQDIGRNTVTLVGADNRELKLGMGN